MASIRDIARIAGASPASVSRILNNDPTFHINDETRYRVIEVAKRLHYDKNKKKGGPKQKDPQLSIALVMRYDKERELNDPYFLNMHAGIDQEAKKWHLKVDQPFRIEQPDNRWDELANYGGAIIEGQMTADAIKKIQAINPNTIFIDVNTNIVGCNIVRNDFIEETVHILDTLHDLGHENIAYIGGKSEIMDLNGKAAFKQNDLRESGYLSWMKVHNLDKYIHYFTADWSIASALEAAKKLLQLKDRPTAVVVGSDPMAIGVYKVFNDAGISIPDDISIVSFDDVELTRYLTPTLSSVYMNTMEMGRVAVRLAKDLITETNKIPLTITCHSQLNIRDSITSRK